MLTALLALLATPAQTPASLTTETVSSSCVAAVSGDRAARKTCLDAIFEQATPMKQDVMAADFSTSCLVVPTVDGDDLIWFYLDWLNDHPDAAAKPASITINAALLEKIPCGWREY